MSATNQSNTAPAAPNAATEPNKGPSPEIIQDIKQKLAAIPPNLYTPTDVNFGFRTTEIDDTNNPGKKVKYKRPTLRLALPLVNFDGIVAALGDASNPEIAEKVQQYVVSLVQADQIAAARSQVNDEETPVGDQEHLDLSKLTITFIAAQPASERRGGGIGKDTWEAFGKDYTEVMLAEGVDSKKIGKAVDWLLKKFAPIKTVKPAIKKLAGLVDLYATKTTNLEDFSECVEFLQNKAKALLNADDAAIADQL